jgi:hypothetical protein
LSYRTGSLDFLDLEDTAVVFVVVVDLVDVASVVVFEEEASEVVSVVDLGDLRLVAVTSLTKICMPTTQVLTSRVAGVTSEWTRMAEDMVVGMVVVVLSLSQASRSWSAMYVFILSGDGLYLIGCMCYSSRGPLRTKIWSSYSKLQARLNWLRFCLMVPVRRVAALCSSPKSLRQRLQLVGAQTLC